LCPAGRAGTLTGMEQDVSWYDIPAVQILGAILGTLLLIAAIRAMFGRRR
jgi:hypothetical protein